MIMAHSIDLSNKVAKGLTLIIDADDEETLFLNNSENSNEAKYQIKEGCIYDYEFETENKELDLNQFSLKCENHEGIVRCRKTKPYLGQISPNIYVGTLQLRIYNSLSKTSYPLDLEVRSVKTTYREDYRYMLNQIAEKCTDLILQANAPVHQSITIDPNLGYQSLYQRFAFIQAMVLSEDFDVALHQIFRNPSLSLKNEDELLDVRNIKRFSSKQTRALINGSQRMEIKNHPLNDIGVHSVAVKISDFNRKEHLDTNENRFLKHALLSYVQFCEDIISHKNAKSPLKDEARQVINTLQEYLSLQFFREISSPQTLNLNSPLLQRKAGYREQLRIWLQFDLAAKLIWEGGDDVYSAGKKDIATLYEYWLFFKLLEVIQKIFKVESKELHKLFASSTKGLDIQLKQGKFKAIDGVYKTGNRPLKIIFSYNKVFNNKEYKDRKKQGSWSLTMRPDYTLSIWPAELKIQDAEELEQIVHIHFDAKYKVANLKNFLDVEQKSEETELEKLDKEKSQNKKGIYKNADLLKMHAYKDAIKRTGGAYVLYPGTESKQLEGFHEILPGLGAFSVSPNANGNETSKLESFLNEVLEHFLNRASQRENISVKTYEITKDGKGNVLKEPIPEYLDDKKLIPDETYVLVGFSKTKDRLKWYLENAKYNFRMNDEKGTVVFKPNVVNAKFLLLRESGKSTASILLKLKEGIKVYSKEHLQKIKYPDATKDHYLVFDFEAQSKDLKIFEGMEWNFKELEEYKKTIEGKNIRSAAGEPFIVTLSELMKVKVK